MRKPTDQSPEANLQAIQTSVAFKHIADAIEQYRRQFGLAFLALIAFSAIHVGLVVIANLYTLETKVSGGVLTAAQTSSVEPPAVATAAALKTYDLGHIMSNLDGSAQKDALSSIKNINFVDHAGKYRQYTVTGFELGGYMNSELTLYTAVGHTLAYVRGEGLTVSTQGNTCNNTCASAAPQRRVRKLLTQSAGVQDALDDGDFVSAEDLCADAALVAFIQTNNENNLDDDGMAYDFTSEGASLRAHSVQLAQCLWNPDGSASNQQGYDLRARDNDVAAMQAYLTDLDARIGFGYWDEVSGETCEIADDGTQADCAMYGISPFSSVGKGPELTVASWTAAAMKAQMDAAGYSACLDAFEHANHDYLLNIINSGSLESHIDSEYASGVAYINSLVSIVSAQSTDEDNVSTFQQLLTAFGLDTLSVEEGLVVLEDPVMVNPEALTEAQQNAVTATGQMMETLAAAIQSLQSSSVQACKDRNEKLAELAMAPLIKGTIDYMSTDAYLADMQKLWETAQLEQGYTQSTQLASCAAAGSRWFNCENYDALYEDCVASVSSAMACEDLQQKRTWSVKGVGGEATSYGGDGTAAYGATTSWQCGSTLEETMAVDGCTLLSLAEQFYNEQLVAWMDSHVEAVHSEVYAEAANAWAINQLDGETDTGTLIATHLDTFLTVTVQSLISTVSDYFTEYKLTNNWDQGKQTGVNWGDTHTQSGSQNFYGCTLTLEHDLIEASTSLSVHAFDVCDGSNGGNEIRHSNPFFSGTYFSKITGGFDDFAIFLPPSYCSAFLAAVAIDSAFVLDPTFDSPLYNSRKLLGSFNSAADYVIMLHGWGGSSDFLSSSAFVLDYAFSGFPGTATGSELGNYFNSCTDVSSVGTGKNACSNLAYPGGFFVLAPDGGGCPLANRMWWTNSEFSGFLMDYVVFDLPSYMTYNLGLTARSVGVFGFSMGAYGSLAIVTTYIQNVAAIYAANAPMYPNDCFFAYNCHQICVTDLIYCELLFTSFGQIINAYVIIWSDSLVVSSGSTDPMGAGIANHMSEKSTYVTCKYYDRTISPNGAADPGPPPAAAAGPPPAKGGNGMAMGKGARKLLEDWTMGELGDAVGEWVAISNIANSMNVGGCTWQDWNPDGNCIIPSSAVNPKGKTSMSVHASVAGIDTTLGNFGCQGGCEGLENLVKAGVWSYNGAATCFAAACHSLEWCLENNDSEGPTKYLDPVASLVAQMKFVPFSNPVSDVMVQSAFGHFYNSMPMSKFALGGLTANTVFATYPVLMYIHCSQNDEMDLYPFHVQYVAMIIGAQGKGGAFFSTDSRFVADFDDCDMHFFTEGDMKVVISWFSDALHTFVGDVGSVGSNIAAMFSIAEVQVQAATSSGLALCWLPGTNALDAAHGAVISTPYEGGNSFLHQESCSPSMLPEGLIMRTSWPDMFSHAEWHDIESQNEAHFDTESAIAVYQAANIASSTVMCNTVQVAAELELVGAISLQRQGLIADPACTNCAPLRGPDECAFAHPDMEPPVM
mmetsp:Transcript_12784/g.15436  ORF Transcript_12784/g.15436 Transcript_12784/m.15436 type:complete len:1508 (-) Transcript_12784:140-4663(-)